jgi:hypothetical protein
MIDDGTVYRLLDQLACEVFREMDDGKTLEEIDDDLVFLRKVDRIALYERIVERFMEDAEDEEVSRAIVAHLRTLKRRKRPQPTHPPAPIPFLH